MFCSGSGDDGMPEGTEGDEGVPAPGTPSSATSTLVTNVTKSSTGAGGAPLRQSPPSSLVSAAPSQSAGPSREARQWKRMRLVRKEDDVEEVLQEVEEVLQEVGKVKELEKVMGADEAWKWLMIAGGQTPED